MCGAGYAGIASGLVAYEPADASGRAKVALGTVIAVEAGKPSELAFTLSRSSALPWAAKVSSERITFKVTNRGALSHDFKVCTTPVTTTAAKRASANSCIGRATRLLGPGQSTTLTVLFSRRGTYEYLSTVPGEAVGGMKGLIGVGVKLPATPPATTTSPETTTTTGTTTAPSSLVGNANSGKVVFASAGCASCTRSPPREPREPQARAWMPSSPRSP